MDYLTFDLLEVPLNILIFNNVLALQTSTLDYCKKPNAF